MIGSLMLNSLDVSDIQMLYFGWECMLYAWVVMLKFRFRIGSDLRAHIEVYSMWEYQYEVPYLKFGWTSPNVHSLQLHRRSGRWHCEWFNFIIKRRNICYIVGDIFAYSPKAPWAQSPNYPKSKLTTPLDQKVLTSWYVFGLIWQNPPQYS